MSGHSAGRAGGTWGCFSLRLGKWQQVVADRKRLGCHLTGVAGPDSLAGPSSRDRFYRFSFSAAGTETIKVIAMDVRRDTEKSLFCTP